MLKIVANEIPMPLSIPFNESLNESKFPDLWKLAHVIPIFKKGVSSSLLSCVSKLFE